MKPARIDFAPPTLYRSLALTRPVTWLAVVAGLALCIGAAVMAQRSTMQASHWEAKRQAAIAQHAPVRPARATTQPIPAGQATAVNAMVARLNVPWRDLFQSIESATAGDRIALLEITPDPARHTLKGTAEARNSEDMLAYMTRLAAQPFFAAVTLTSHEINLQDPNRPLRFQFAAQWRDALPEAAVARPVSVSGTVAGRQP